MGESSIFNLFLNLDIDLQKNNISNIVLHDHPEELIPARLAFMIMAHKDSHAVMELLHSIYRERHLYVIHVDKRAAVIREELRNAVAKSHFDNVYVLPEYRSFVTSWASYQIVRAELEGFEELLRMGIWDFVINLSGADLPLRSVDDLALALAPYRGLSFLPFLHLKDSKRNATSDNLDRCVFYACDGYVYNITSNIEMPSKGDFELYSASQWGTFSRDFIEYLVDEKLRSILTNKYQFYLQTHVIPDESYIPTILMNSPYRNSLHLASVQASKEFLGRNAIDLCRHLLNDADFCGQGPDSFKEEDTPKLMSLSHRSFFARKFHTQTSDVARHAALALMHRGYYGFFEEFFPVPIMQALAEHAILQFCKSNSIPDKVLCLESISKLHVTPALVPHDTCCRTELITGLRKMVDYNYWMDLSIFNKTDANLITGRVMMEPVLSNRYCYPDGNLKMIFISPWMEQDRMSFGLDQTLPLPYSPAYSSGISGLLLLSHDLDVPKCSGSFKGDPVTFPDISKPVELIFRLISPQGNTRCISNETVYLNDPDESSTDDDDKNESQFRIHPFVIRCGKMESGPWSLQMMQSNLNNSRIYNFPFYLLDYKNTDIMNTQLKDVKQLWKIKAFAILSKDYTFQFQEPYDFESDKYAMYGKIVSSTVRQAKNGVPTVSPWSDTVKVKPTTNFEWFICSGGIASVTVAFLILFYLMCIHRYRFQRMLVYVYVPLIILGMVLQILVFIFYCRE